MIKVTGGKYSCFKARVICNECGKQNQVYDYSWESHHIGMADKSKIKESVNINMVSAEHNRCIKCGAIINLDIE